jgi:hypothetical protein
VQWATARELCSVIAKANYPRKHPWTLTHSFFVVMGGFAVDCSECLPGQPIVHLTAAGAARVVHLGYKLPDVPKETITDRSKADPLGKLLVCVQAGYTIVQVLARLISRLPVTLLEVNTIGHVMCALLMYGFWFPKPLDVHEPLLMSDD